MRDVFDIIKEYTGKRFIYGTGDGADKLIDYLENIGITIDGICVSDSFYREKVFRGMKATPVLQTADKNPNAMFMMAFGIKNADEIFSLSKKFHIIYPEMPVVGNIPFTKETLDRDEQKIKAAYSLLADKKSKEVFENILRFRLTGDISYLSECETEAKEGYELIIKNKGKEILFDCGAYNGDTADDFNKYAEGLEDLYAAEPCPKSFQKLKAKYGNYNLFGCAIGKDDSFAPFVFSRGRGSVLSHEKKLKTGKITTVPIKTVDGLLSGKRCTIIKYDTEGSEEDALLGSTKTINNYHPSLLIAAYHKADDIYTLPLLLDSICKGYKIYLRHHPCLPSWETNIYAVFENNKNS